MVFIILKNFKVSSSQWKPWQLYHRTLVQSAAAYRDWILQMSLLGRKHLEEQTMETESGAICETETKPETRNFSENSDDRTKKPKKKLEPADSVFLRNRIFLGSNFAKEREDFWKRKKAKK